MGIMDKKEILMEMVNLKPDQTGLPFELFVSEKEYASNQHHRPRVKILNKQNTVNASISFDDDIEILGGYIKHNNDFKKIEEYIQLNKKLLYQLWNGEINQTQYSNNQQKIK